MSELAPFDVDGRCPKCGHDNIATYYTPAMIDAGWFGRKVDSAGKRIEQEYLSRRCCRCHYDWAEAVALSQAERRSD